MPSGGIGSHLICSYAKLTCGVIEQFFTPYLNPRAIEQKVNKSPLVKILQPQKKPYLGNHLSTTKPPKPEQDSKAKVVHWTMPSTPITGFKMVSQKPLPLVPVASQEKSLKPTYLREKNQLQQILNHSITFPGRTGTFAPLQGPVIQT